MRWFNRLSLLALGVFACMTFAGCSKPDRTAQIQGAWDWGKYTVRFDDDKTWDAVDKRMPDFQKMGGTWAIEGDTLSLDYVGSAPPGGSDSVFMLSDDGMRLSASTGSVGVMRKQLAARN